MTANGVKDATDDPDQLAEWGERWPSANWAIACGPDFFVVDLDRKPGKDGLAALKALGTVPRTRTVRTGSGGLHLYFIGDAPNTASRIASGIDTRGSNGYVMAPGSSHASGNTYELVVDSEIADPPAWLMERLEASDRPAPDATERLDFGSATPEVLEAARDALEQHGPAIEGQAGDNRTFAAAALLRHDFALSEEEAWPLFLEWNATCQPPWDEEALAAKLAGGLKYGKAEYGCKRKLDALEAAKREIRKWRESGTGAAGVAKLVKSIEQIVSHLTDPVVLSLVKDEVMAATGLKKGDIKHLRVTRTFEDLKASKPVIKLIPGKLDEIVTLSEQALLGADAQIYSRGGLLVRPVVEDVDAAHGRRTSIARLRRVDQTYMRDLLCRLATFARPNEKTMRWTATDPPLDVAQTLLSREGEWRFRPIAGIITTPTLLSDGSILIAEGYDPVSRLLLVGALEIPPIPESPTREDAQAALELLKSLLVEFPFVDEPSKSVVLSAILTVVCRGAFPVAPAHATSASTPGTGKSYCFDVVATIATGQLCPVITAARSEEELEKRLGAALIAGQPITSLDNMSFALGGDALCQAIERPVVEIRILGRSELARVESRSTVFATGNNLILLNDVVRRFVVAKLDANLERPELRQFKQNPVQRVLADRGRYVAAALLIARAYAVAGRPNPLPKLASFEGWSDIVRSALAWLGCADPVLTMEAARAEDPLLAHLRSVLVNWAATLGTGRAKAHTAAEVLKIAQFPDPHIQGTNEFGEAIQAVASNHGRPDARTLGKWLSKHKGRITAGFRLNGESDANGHAARWWVEENCG